MASTNRTSERGNVFFYLFLMLFLIGVLTYTVSQMAQSGDKTDIPQQRDQVARLVQQASLLSGAIQQMIVNGADPNALASKLDMVTSGNGWDTPPSNYKIYHPYGGGVKYMSQTGAGATLSNNTNMANNFQVRTASYVKGVGPTDSLTAYPDILFTAQVASLSACQLINNIVRGTAVTATPPTVTNVGTAFANVFTDTAGGSVASANAVLDDSSGTCTACVNVPASCVQNAGGTSFGYYQVLLPG